LFKLSVVLCLVAFLSIFSQKAIADQTLSDKELAEYISSTLASSLDEKAVENNLYCDDLGCAVVVQ